MKRRIIGIIIFIIGLVLFMDEIWMVLPWLNIGAPGWLIGDWTWAHVEPFHHWMWGALLMLGGGVLAR